MVGCLDIHALSLVLLLSFSIIVRVIDIYTIISNVFPLRAIHWFHSGSLDSSAKLKGASMVVLKDREYWVLRTSVVVTPPVMESLY